MIPLLGEIHRTAVWAQDWRSDEHRPGVVALSLPPGKILALLQLGGTVECLETGTGAGSGGKPGGGVGLTFAGSGSTGLRLRIDPDFDGMLIGFDGEALRRCLGEVRPALDGGLRSLMDGGGGAGAIRRETAAWSVPAWVAECRQPPVAPAARPIWFDGKIREFVALSCFDERSAGGEFFCTRQKQLARARVRRVKQYLAEHLDEALDLNALARLVGCSAHHLSRSFSESAGTTISRHLRRLRIERAASLLASGRFNVSEAAVEVGYQSLSHFSKAFLEEKGCLPSKFDRRAA